MSYCRSNCSSVASALWRHQSNIVRTFWTCGKGKCLFCMVNKKSDLTWPWIICTKMVFKKGWNIFAIFCGGLVVKVAKWWMRKFLTSHQRISHSSFRDVRSVLVLNILCVNVYFLCSVSWISEKISLASPSEISTKALLRKSASEQITFLFV